MSEQQITRTPEQQAKHDARARLRSKVEAVDVEITAEQQRLDALNARMEDTRQLALTSTRRLDELKAHRATLVSPVK
ncbi:MAG TPA: hypothetical protein VFN67_02285 [Polyangiales bacterium]|nr:hypothetical protein [Polyangiales bacterium]